LREGKAKEVFTLTFSCSTGGAQNIKMKDKGKDGSKDGSSNKDRSDKSQSDRPSRTGGLRGLATKFI
jgi:hypothetical protein